MTRRSLFALLPGFVAAPIAAGATSQPETSTGIPLWDPEGRVAIGEPLNHALSVPVRKRRIVITPYGPDFSVQADLIIQEPNGDIILKNGLIKGALLHWTPELKAEFAVDRTRRRWVKV